MQNIKLYVGAVFMTLLVTIGSALSYSPDQQLQSDAILSRAPRLVTEPAASLTVNQSFALTVIASDTRPGADMSISINEGPEWVALTGCIEVESQARMQCNLEGISPVMPGMYLVQLQVTTSDGRSSIREVTLNVS